MAAAAALLIASIATASAQGRRGGGFMRGGLQLLNIKEVQDELKMAPEQVSKIADKQQEVRQAMQEARQSAGNFQDMSPEDRAKFFAKMQEIQNKAVSDILDTKQMKRFHQLELQQQGPMAITRPDVAAELKLTDDQKKQIGEVQQKAQADQRAMMQGVDFQNMSQEERAQFGAKMQAAQKATGEKLLALLTDDQKKTWKDMQGEPFKFPAPQPRAGATR
jgi:acyl-CoA reductase-like NAD-dependent aldehyde dehydrogenase